MYKSPIRNTKLFEQQNIPGRPIPNRLDVTQSSKATKRPIPKPRTSAEWCTWAKENADEARCCFRGFEPPCASNSDCEIYQLIYDQHCIAEDPPDAPKDVQNVQTESYKKSPIRNTKLFEDSWQPGGGPIPMPWLDPYQPPYISTPYPHVGGTGIKPWDGIIDTIAPTKEPDWPFDGMNCYSSENGDLHCEGKTGHIYTIPCGTYPAADCQDGSEGIPWGTDPIDESIMASQYYT